MDEVIKGYFHKGFRTVKSSKEEIVFLLSWTWPVLISNILNQVVYLLVNMIFVGHLGTNELAAVALGNTWSFCTSSLILGSLNAMDTFISQSFGAKQYKFIGLTVQRAGIISIVLSVFVSILWFITKPILILIHQDPHVSALTQDYILGLLPGLWFGNALTILQKYLQGQGIMTPSIVVGVILNIFNAIFNYIFVHGLTSNGGLGVVGSSLATSLSKFISIILLLLWIKYFRLHKDTWFGFSKESLNVQGLKEYLRLGIPAGLQLSFEGWGFEILTILSGTFGPTQLDGHSIAMNFTFLTFMMPLSLSIALSVRIGQLLGSKNAAQAKRSTRIGFAITMSLMVFISLTQFLTRHVIGMIYTKEKEVQILVSHILPISALFQFFDGFQTTCQGIIRGTGKNKIGAIVNFISFYVVGLPFSCIFAFALHKEVVGLWWGLCIGLCACAIVLGSVVLRINWDAEVDKAIKRTSSFVELDQLDDEKASKIEQEEEDDFDKFNKEETPGSLSDAILYSSQQHTIKSNDKESLLHNSQEEGEEEDQVEIEIDGADYQEISLNTSNINRSTQD
ncbi:hypothetical protein CYY_009400 [Polysphondylium violaceum]|uniref:Multi antimicrobial extrusion family protein n=1 Tax=Polysphondylium violaceum TaxID=133409 RepID=A0A8J4PTQ6_9MYCE|nr:hypothetical protein CYY_009400 [Polysphondylium violaceum]